VGGRTHLQRAAEAPLFRRTPQGLFPAPAGEALARRIARAFARLDPALADSTGG
jgi:DNA-binding transcriptional LysR family regulator